MFSLEQILFESPYLPAGQIVTQLLRTVSKYKGALHEVHAVLPAAEHVRHVGSQAME